ncbi:RHS repeat domain-containing protein, partial [Pseudidiomarina piscicola]|uniref:RHS repeat domain-containing protein n=1 Tax=Pseudidiomarina piscicola TaxID=2614830 RepID=UPI001C2D9AA0
YRLTKTTVCAIGQCGGAQTQITEYTYSGSTGLIQSKTLTNASGTLSQTTTYTYDAVGRQLIEDGPLSGSDDATSYRYDLSGRPTWEIGARNAAGFYPAQKTTYPTVSTRRTLVQSGTVASRGSTSLTIDTLQTDYLDVNNRVSKSTLAAPSTLTKATQYTYDARGRLRCEATRMNAASFGALPASACTLGSEGSAGPDRITSYSYDANSNLISTLTGLGTAAEGIEQFTAYTANGEVSRREDGNGNSTLYSYDGHDRVYRTTFPDASYEQNSYDANGNLTAFRKRDGVTLIHSYDSQDQRTSSVIPNESTIYFSYDSLGRETQITRGTQVVAYGYDGLGRRISERTNNRTLSYTFDNANRRTRTTFPDGFYVTYNHDAGGRLTNIFENGASAVIDFSYDRAGRVSRIERAGSTITTLNYDGMGRVLDFDHQGFNDSSYSYNPASQLQSKTVSTADYQIQVPTQSTEFYSVNNLNQYTQVTVDGVPEYANYTSAGNLTGFDGWSYVYDAHNRLVTANGSDDTVALSYDATGRLTRTVHNGEIIDYLYDADELVAEYHSNGTLLRRFIHGLGNDDPVIRYEGAGVNARRYLLADERGSIIAEMTANGGLLQAHQYDAYGNPKNSSDARFRFTGQILIPGTELYYYKARVYHPRLGRFMQTDPIGYKDGMNWYAYVGNDPLNMVDSNGRVAESLWDAASLSVGIVSFSKNLYQGNWSAAGVDAIGVIADGAALALPFVPGGAGMAISASRKAESAISGVKFEKQLASESQLTELAEGGGTIISQPAKQADRIAAQHGIDAANVQKVSSSAHKAKDGTSLETHAFRDATTNSVLEPKTIMICTGSRIKRSSC